MIVVKRTSASVLARALLAALALLTACSSVPPPPVEPVDDAKRPDASGAASDMLAGHLVVDLPPGAVTQARRTSIMAAPQASADETRVVLEEGGTEGLARFVMMVTELYLVGSGDLRADAMKLAAKDERVVELKDARLPSFGLEPTSPPKSDRPLFVFGTVIAHPDGSLQQAEFFILPDMADARGEYADRARAIARTFGAGTRKLDPKGGRTTIGASLVADLPPSFLVSTQQGPDFDVFRIRKLHVPGESGATLGIYVGGHPSLQIDQISREGGAAPQSRTEDGTLLERPAKWVTWSGPDGLKVKEAIVELGDHRAVHVFGLAANDADLEVLSRIAATLRRAP